METPTPTTIKPRVNEWLREIRRFYVQWFSLGSFWKAMKRPQDARILYSQPMAHTHTLESIVGSNGEIIY